RCGQAAKSGSATGEAKSSCCDASESAKPSKTAEAASKFPRSPKSERGQRSTCFWYGSTSPALEDLEGKFHGVFHISGGLRVIDLHELHIRRGIQNRITSKVAVDELVLDGLRQQIIDQFFGVGFVRCAGDETNCTRNRQRAHFIRALIGQNHLQFSAFPRGRIDLIVVRDPRHHLSRSTQLRT